MNIMDGKQTVTVTFAGQDGNEDSVYTFEVMVLERQTVSGSWEECGETDITMRVLGPIEYEMITRVKEAKNTYDNLLLVSVECCICGVDEDRIYAKMDDKCRFWCTDCWAINNPPEEEDGLVTELEECWGFDNPLLGGCGG